MNETNTMGIDEIDEVVSIDESCINLSDVENEEEVSSDSDLEVLSATYYPTSVSELKNHISKASTGDTIVLSGNYNIQDYTINKELTFIGTNDATFDGKSNNIFTIKDSKVTFINITFKNGYAKSGGSLRASSGQIIIDQCKFLKSYAVDYGGTISITGNAYCKISNSYFTNSQSNNMGGVIYTTRSIDIINCTFENNKASGSGGVIRYDGASSLNIINCAFNDNNARDYGGVIDAKGSNINIINSNFTNCYCSNNEGGAISLDAVENMKISGCNFNSCTSKAEGGAIRIDASKNIDIKNSTIANCKSGNNGGAICIGNSNNKISSNVTLDTCRFIKNSAKNDGGAISRHECDLFNVKNSYFESNTAQWGGAIINDKYTDGLISNSTFKNNTATQDAGAVSGGTVSQCKFISNSAINYGGATSWVTSSDSTFENNYVEGQGGAMYNGGAFNSTFVNNTAQGKGGAITLTQSVSIDTCLFINNSGSYGGAICKPEGNVIDSIITNSNFTGNHASSSGGAICIQDVKSNLLQNCSFKDNYASTSGAVDYYRSENIEISGCEFTNSSSSGSAGSIGLWSVNSINLNNCNFTDSTAESGGAIYWSEGDDLNLNQCKFENCVSNDGSSYIELSSETSNSNLLDCLFDVDPQGVTVSYESILTVNDLSLVDGEEGVLAVQLYNVLGPINGANINFTINGVTVSRLTTSEGLAYYSVENLKLGENEVNISYAGENNYLPVSVKPSVRLNTYKGNLSVTQEGKYYQDTNLIFKLLNSKDNNPIQYARIQLTFSNGVNVELTTDKNGECKYSVPFIPNNYSYVAKVIDSNVDVNTVSVNNLTVNSINGIIDFTQTGRIFTIKLYDPDTGDVFKNLEVNLFFSNGESDFIKTNNNGIARFNFPYDKGTYSVLLNVNGNDYTHFNDVELKNIVIDTEYENSQDFISGSKVTFSGNIIFNYLKSGSATMAVIGGQITNGFVIDHPEAAVTIKGNVITVSNLGVGKYKLQVEISPDDYHYANNGYTDIIVNEVKSSIKVASLTTYSKSGDVLKFKLVDSSTNKPLANMKVTLKVYTGSKFSNIVINTNANGEGSVKVSDWAVGTHKVVLSFSKYGYVTSSVTSSVKVLKTTKLSFKVKSKADKTGSTLSVWVKSGKKYLNGVKLKLYVYNGKKVVKTITVVTGKYKDAKKKINKGFIAYGTNALKAGKHKIVIKPVSKKYTGSKTTKLSIKKTAKKYKKTSVIVTKGKRHVID